MSMYPDPSGYEPPPRRGGDVDPLGVLLLVLVGLSILRFGLWWGLSVAALGFLVIVVVGAANLASAREEQHRRLRRPRLAQAHSLASSFLADLLGFGVSTLVVPGASGSLIGIVAAATVLTVLDEIVGRLLDLNWSGARGSWCLLMIVYFAVAGPVAAWIAPHYRLTGVGANVATIALLFTANLIVGRASPWRERWNQPNRAR